VALAAAAGVRGVVPDGDDREQLKVRVEELVERSGVDGILAELCSALTPAL
jgi:hypothetical protein